MTAVAFCIPGDISLPTGGYRFDREVMARLPGCGVDVTHVRLGQGFPHPTDAQAKSAFEALKTVDRRTILLVDGLALGAMPPAAIAALPHRRVALVHHPLGLEAGMPPARAAFLIENEIQVLAEVSHVIVTSEATRRILLADFKVPDRKITVAEPGTARHSRAVGTALPCHVLAVGAVSARKAYGVLVEALAAIPEVDWRLTIAGSLILSPDATSDLQDAIARTSCASRIALTGVLDDPALNALFARADVFAMSSLFEGYGMALAEALARGLPIVTSTGGAAADTVPDAAAIKVAPGCPAALTDALRRVMTDAPLRRRMADAAWASAALLPTWDDTARDIADVVKTL